MQSKEKSLIVEICSQTIFMQLNCAVKASFGVCSCFGPFSILRQKEAKTLSVGNRVDPHSLIRYGKKMSAFP